MRISDLPAMAEFRDRKDVKVLRHYSSEFDLWQRRRDGTFDAYQNSQGRPVFLGANIVISFIAERHRFAKFIGVWRVLRNKRLADGSYRYTTDELGGFADLEARMIVSWGDGTRSWVQWLHQKGDKEISEILPRNYVREFPGFLNFCLGFDELATMVQHPDANREWVRMLSSVAGVYCLLDRHTGKQYVGSAYGAGGIWSRWCSYAQSGSGGNLQLRALIDANPRAMRRFQFSILRVLEPGAPKDEVLAHERLLKAKLGSRVFGLNSN